LQTFLKTSRSDIKVTKIRELKQSNKVTKMARAQPFRRAFIKNIAASEISSNNNRAVNYQRPGDSFPIAQFPETQNSVTQLQTK
jgi:hypothetical protein